MKFLDRNPTNQSDKYRQQGPARHGDEVARRDPRSDVFYSIDDAAPRTHMGKRPHTAAGLEQRQRNTPRPWTGTKEAREPTRSEHLQKPGRMIEYTDGLDTFRFPSPSPCLTPTPRSAAHRSLPLQAQQSSTGPHALDSPKIGVAIGSPSHAPPNWGRSYTCDQISTRMPGPRPTRTAPNPPTQGLGADAQIESKKSKQTWKTLFRWTSPKPAQVQKRAATSTEGRFADSQPANASFRAERSAPHKQQVPTGSVVKADEQPRHTPRYPTTQPLNQRGTVDSLPTESESPSFKQNLKTRMRRLSQSQGIKTPSPRPVPPRRESLSTNAKTKGDPRRDSPMASFEQTPLDAFTIASTPRLDVPIERAEFERYSVMFAKPLANDSKQSLFERRQSRLQSTPTDDEATCSVPSIDELRIQTQFPIARQRSTTSPRRLSRPLTVRVQDCGNFLQSGMIAEGPATSIARPAAVKRANTAPVGSSLPFSTSFSQRKPTLESSPESPGSGCFSTTSISTPTTFTTVCTDKVSVELTPGLVGPAEPTWDMMTPEAARPIDSPSTTTLLPTESSSSRPAYPHVNSTQDLERQMVQVSVARQVSVSRARSRVQDAVTTSSFKQPLRPRVVQLDRNRKSHVGVVGNLDDDWLSVRSRSTSDSLKDKEAEGESRPAMPVIASWNDED